METIIINQYIYVPHQCLYLRVLDLVSSSGMKRISFNNKADNEYKLDGIMVDITSYQNSSLTIFHCFMSSLCFVGHTTLKNQVKYFKRSIR